MKKKLYRAALAVILLWGGLFQASAGRQQDFRIGGIEDYPLNPLAQTILTEAYRPLGITLQFSEWPSPRSLALTDSGQLDGEMGRIAGRQRDYPDIRQVNVPLITLNIVAVSTSPALQNIPWPYLGRYRIGISRGLLLYEKMPLDGGDTEDIATAERLLLMLRSDRLDLVLVPQLVAAVWQRQPGPPLYITPYPQGVFPVYHYVNKRHSDLIPALEQSLLQMQDSGRLLQLKEEFMQRRPTPH